MSLPFVDLNEYQVDKSHQHGAGRPVPSQPAAAIVHYQRTHHRGHGQPENFAAIDDVSASTGMPVIPMVAMPSQVKDAINRYLRA